MTFFHYNSSFILKNIMHHSLSNIVKIIGFIVVLLLDVKSDDEVDYIMQFDFKNKFDFYRFRY